MKISSVIHVLNQHIAEHGDTDITLSVFIQDGRSVQNKQAGGVNAECYPEMISISGPEIKIVGRTFEDE